MFLCLNQRLSQHGTEWDLRALKVFNVWFSFYFFLCRFLLSICCAHQWWTLPVLWRCPNCCVQRRRKARLLRRMQWWTINSECIETTHPFICHILTTPILVFIFWHSSCESLCLGISLNPLHSNFSLLPICKITSCQPFDCSTIILHVLGFIGVKIYDDQ